jgi:5-methylcytosine-specific restriction protein A
MPRSPRAHCSHPLCSGYATHGAKCERHAIARERESDAARGTAAARGYNSRRWVGTRKTVLRRDPICRCDAGDHGHEPFQCMRISSVADHFPRSRKELLAAGVPDPDLPEFCRGLCRSCHSRETAKHQPGGWAARATPLT